MKYFPVKTMIICLLVTPMLYFSILHYLESRLNTVYQAGIKNHVIGDTRDLLNGSVLIQDRISANIHRFTSDDILIRYGGLDFDVFVTTRTGRVLYPAFIGIEPSVGRSGNPMLDMDAIAGTNYDTLNEGIVTTAKVRISHNSLMARALMMTLLILVLAVFVLLSKTAGRKARAEQQEKEELIDGLIKGEKAREALLMQLKDEREKLFNNIQQLNKKYEKGRKKAKINEEELFEEIISLEEKLNAFIEYKKNKEEEIEGLKLTIRKYERRKSGKSKRMEFDYLAKRFSTVYKNVSMKRKAIVGYINLNDEQQIKVEEIIHQLDAKPEIVNIKRKVFIGKKHKSASFEVLFAYNGRLYFSKTESQKVQVLVIGTKNTQLKDMEYLHKI